MVILHHQNAGPLKGQQDSCLIIGAYIDREHVTIGQDVSSTTDGFVFLLWILMIFSYYEILTKSLDIEQIDPKTF